MSTSLHAHLKDDVFVGLEEPEVAVQGESGGRRVEQVDCEGGQHTGEEDHPAELHAPEGRDLLHGEQQTADRGPECSRHARRHTGRREVSSDSSSCTVIYITAVIHYIL